MSAAQKIRKCERCGKWKRVLYDIDGRNICADCVENQAFYEVFKESFRNHSLRGEAVRVGIDLGNLTFFNPFSQAWFFPLYLWIFLRDYGKTLRLDELKRMWRYKTPLEKVLRIYLEEDIFKIEKAEGIEIIREGPELELMLKKYGDRPDAYEIIGAWICGVIISRLNKEPDAPSFRYVAAASRAISRAAIDNEGNIVGEPFSKITGYICKICGQKFSTRKEVEDHLKTLHLVPSDEVPAQIEAETTIVAYLVPLDDLVSACNRELVKPEYLIQRIERFGALVHEDREIPRIIERNGTRYLLVDPSWVRLLARAKVYERDLILGRERLK